MAFVDLREDGEVSRGLGPASTREGPREGPRLGPEPVHPRRGHDSLRISAPPRPTTPVDAPGAAMAPKSPGARRWQNLRNKLMPTRSTGRPLSDEDVGGPGNPRFSWRSMSIGGWTRPSVPGGGFAGPHELAGAAPGAAPPPGVPRPPGLPPHHHHHADTAPAAPAPGRGSPERAHVPEAQRPDRAAVAARKIPLLSPFIPIKLRGQLAGTYTRALESVEQGVAAPTGLCGADVSRRMRPSMLRQAGAVMIADVTGFTALTELLSQQGSVGLELLTRCMNKYFTQVIDEILTHGGDVMRFAGDSMIVLFSPTSEEALATLDGGLQSALMRAVACAHALTTKFGAMRMLPNGDVVEYVGPSAAEGDGDRAEGGGEGSAATREASREGASSSSGRNASVSLSGVSSSERLLSPVGSLLGSAGRPVAATLLGAADSVSVAVEGILVGAASAASRTKARHRERTLRGLASVDEGHAPGADDGAATREPSSLASAGTPHSASCGGPCRPARHRRTPSGASSKSEGGAGDASKPCEETIRKDAEDGVRISNSDASNNVAAERVYSGEALPSPHALAAATSPPSGEEPEPDAGDGAGALNSAASSAQERVLQEMALARLAEFTGQLKSVRPPELPPHRGAGSRGFGASGSVGQSFGDMVSEGSSLGHALSAPDGALDGPPDRGVGLRPSALSEPGVPGQRGVVLAVRPGPLDARGVADLPPRGGALPLVAGNQTLTASRREDDQGVEAVQPRTGSGTAATPSALKPPPETTGAQAPAARALQPTPITEEASEMASSSCDPSVTSLTEPSGPSDTFSWGSVGHARAGLAGRRAGAAPGSHLGVRGGALGALRKESSQPGARRPRRSIGRLVKQVRAALSRGFGSGGGGLGSRGASAGGEAMPLPSSSAAQSGASRAGGPALSLGWRAAASGGRGGRPGGGAATSVAGMASLADLSDRLGDFAGRNSSLNMSGSLSPVARGADSGTAGSVASDGTGGEEAAAAVALAARRSRRRQLGRRTSRHRSAAAEGVRLGEALAAGAGAGVGGASALSELRQPTANSVSDSSDKVLLSMKMLVSAGTVCLFMVGGGLEPSDEEGAGAAGSPRWDFFMSDAPHALPGSKRQPIAQLAAIEKHASSGETVVSEEAARLIGSKCRLLRLDEGTHRLLSPDRPGGPPATSASAASLHELGQQRGPLQAAFSRKQVASEPPSAPASLAGARDEGAEADAASPPLSPQGSLLCDGTPRPRADDDGAEDAAALAALPPDRRYRALQMMRMFVPLSSRKRVELGHIDYLHETRLVTVLFLGFPALTRPLLKKNRRPDVKHGGGDCAGAPPEPSVGVEHSQSAPPDALPAAPEPSGQGTPPGAARPAHSAGSAPAALGEVARAAVAAVDAGPQARAASAGAAAGSFEEEEEGGALRTLSADGVDEAVVGVSARGLVNGDSNDGEVAEEEEDELVNALDDDAQESSRQKSPDRAHFTSTPPPPQTPQYTPATEEEEISSVQTTLEVIQRRMRHYDGCFMQMRCDEKGFLAICVFGLPGNSHEDRAVRGVQAAMSIAAGLRRHGLSTHIGVTSGQLFCTLVGSQRRMEATLFGDSINLSARLMCKARDGLGTILVDRPTFVQARMRIPFQELEPLRVKGRAEPINVFVPLPPGAPAPPPIPPGGSFTSAIWRRGAGERGPAPPPGREPSDGSLAAAVAAAAAPHVPESVASDDAGAAGSAAAGSAAGEGRVAALRRVGSLATAPPLSSMPELKPMVGRRRELGIVLARARALVSDHQGGVILVEGEHGMGKTRLAAEIQTELLAGRAGQVFAVTGRGVVERRTDAFYAWRRVFAALFLHDAEAAKRDVDAASAGQQQEEGAEAATSTNGPIADAGDLAAAAPAPALPTEPASTALARRLARRVPRYAVWRGCLAEALGLPAEALPPVVSAGHLAHAASASDLARAAGETDDDAPPLRRHHAAWSPGAPPSPGLHGVGRRSVNLATLQSGTTMAAAAGPGGAPWRVPEPEPESPMQRAPSGALHATQASLEEDGSLGGSLGASDASDLDGGDGPEPGHAGVDPVEPGGGSVIVGPYVAAARAAAQAGGARGPSIAQRVPQVKTQQLQELLVEILREFTACYGPLVILIEDVHYCDSSSWVLSWLISRELSRSVLYIATYRPGFTQLSSSQRSKDRKTVMVQKIRDALTRMLRESTTVHLQLAPFDPEETREFVSYALPGIRVPDHVMNMLWEKSSGHPAFLEQFVVFLQYYSRMAAQALATGTVPPGGGPSTFQLVSRGMEFIRNTVGIHSIIQDRVDRLPPEHALTLKVASVGGLTIYVDLLQAAHPQSPSLEEVLASLDFLQSAGFVQQDAMDDNLWRFTQVLARDVVFDTIPITQRREWHGRLARAMERLAPELPLPASTIAYHWSESCAGLEVAQWPRALKAMEYWESAAAQAVDAGAPAEAINLLQKAQDLAETLDRYFASHTHSVWMIRGSSDGRLPIVPRARRIHWERCMAAMSGGAGLTRESVTQAQVHCLRALALAGLPMPWEPAYHAHDRWRRRLRIDWRPRSRLLRACFGYSPEPFGVILERRMTAVERESMPLMRPAPLGPDGPDGAAPLGLMSRPGAAGSPWEDPEAAGNASAAPDDASSDAESRFDPYLPNVRDEIIIVLDILCICLFLGRPLDEEGLRYLMWVCRHIQAIAPWSRWGALQRIVADVRTVLSDSEAGEKKFLRVAPLVGLSEHVVEALARERPELL